ncbi:ATP-binding protein [Sphingomonas gilva]|uniref:ATP-binding protein n=1 Tax=Sphingomonas gilva TaxID=2305907 RepID=A0A396S3N7_9SPHN|nr:ATP-binding protein [Sphingomonas gilva]RHW18015.1 ATP-binding protein [Sphingomonas gilva]
MTDDALIRRIAEALERLSPPPAPAADPQAHAAYVWQASGLVAVADFRPLPLDALKGIERQKAALLDTVRRLAAGHAAHDVLLWGARGTGKSALVKAAVGAVQAEGGDVALIELARAALERLPALFDAIRGLPRAYAVFIDDLGFDEPAEARAMRSVLEGGAEARPANARLFVTSNRRHLIQRDHAAEASAINPRDAADDQLALADRFGLSLGFHVVDQAGYLAIVRGYAERYGLAFEDADAVAWATQRGGRSGRVAWQYVEEIAGRAGRSLE